MFTLTTTVCDSHNLTTSQSCEPRCQNETACCAIDIGNTTRNATHGCFEFNREEVITRCEPGKFFYWTEEWKIFLYILEKNVLSIVLPFISRRSRSRLRLWLSSCWWVHHDRYWETFTSNNFWLILNIWRHQKQLLKNIKGNFQLEKQMDVFHNLIFSDLCYSLYLMNSKIDDENVHIDKIYIHSHHSSMRQ